MIFVNSGQMHYAFWDKPCNCEFQCTIFHPSIATHESTQEQMDYILHNSPPYLILHPEVLSEKELIDLVLELYRSAQKQEGAYALQLYSCIYRICYRLWEKMQNVVNPWDQTTASSWRQCIRWWDSSSRTTAVRLLYRISQPPDLSAAAAAVPSSSAT